ncbi:Beta-glucosidase [Rhodotorula toruloides ATCC 204091]|uniref:beta-glucosidase n=1 Tax=Rhodotorula toruloides TaxID=5286 RepID=A0A0K3CIV7_RHOTO|nr:Beta-glucosidase [Rhodotorula toruloides ATCC 204091]KAK4329688.1 Beta-glucosidase [Rhodotorula toruloides]
MAPLTLEEFAQADLHDVLARLTVKERISLLAGPDWWTTTPIPRIGVPSIKVSDGPNGVRGSSHFRPTPAQTLPCATALGATFDVEAVEKMGKVLAHEAKAKGSSLLLAPTVNIQRNPLNGRAFESFSEDPLLSGYLAAAYIDGLQKNGVGATIKHYVGNDQEHERLSVDVLIPERALREIYLKPFEIAQRVAKPWSFMTSYSRVNSAHVSESKELLQDILRDEWKFDGLVMSDWHGTYSTDGAINAGLDLEMPGPTRWRGELVTHLLAAGKIEVEAINARAYAVLQAVQRSCQADLENVRTNRRPEVPNDSQTDRDTCRAVSSDTIVLLKNERNVLPLKKSIKKLAVIGPNAKTRTVSGGGSAYLTASYVVTPYEGIKEVAEKSGIEVQYEPGCYAHRYLPMLDGLIRTKAGGSGWTATFYNEAIESNSPSIAVVDLLGTRIRINDQKPEGLADLFFLELEGYITPDESGPYDFGISLVGRAQVFVDEKLVVDNGWTTKQTPGPSFYGLGTVEEVGTVAVQAGKTYKIVVRYTNHPREVAEEREDEQDEEEGGQKQPSLMMAALRLGGAPRIQEDESIEHAVKLAGGSDAVVVVIGTNMDWEAEAADRASLALPGRTDELVSRVLAANPNAIIVNQSGSAVAFPWIDAAATVVQAWFGGNCAGQAIADVLFEGGVNPSGRMPLSFPYRIEDCTAHLNWGSESGKVLYGEGIFVGYRGYEETARSPMFAFGEGLSYTSFEWFQLSATLATARPSSATELSISISLRVRNTGNIAGRDVVQIYVLPPSTSTYRRPARELKGFVKTRLLAPGQEETVKLELPKEALAYWRDSKDSKNGWVAEKGEYTVAAQRSSREVDVVETVRVRLNSTVYWRGL